MSNHLKKGSNIVEVLITKNAIIRIHRPDITEEERAKRMKVIEKAAINLIRATQRAEALKVQTKR